MKPPKKSVGDFDMELDSCVACNVCDNNSRFDGATEIALIASNVRKFADERFTVWRCSGCGSLHSKEGIDLARYYEGYVYQSHKADFFTRCGYRNRLAVLRKHGINPESSILDYGCGSGLFVQYLRQQGYHSVRGYDAFDPQFQDRSPLDKTYDVVVSYDVIEHVIEPRQFIAEMAGLANQGGMIFVGTPNAAFLTLTPSVSVELHQPFHRHILSEESLVQLAQNSHLELIEMQRRHYLDTIIPTVNLRFAWEYVAANGGLVDALVEPPNWRLMFSRFRPRLLFFALFGYFFHTQGNMLACLRKSSDGRD